MYVEVCVSYQMYVEVCVSYQMYVEVCKLLDVCNVCMLKYL